MVQMICTRCKKEIIPMEHPRYSVADSDDGTEGEHWECHEAFVKEVRDGFARIEIQSKEVRKILDQLDKPFTSRKR
jgi:hypothetical protein